VANKVAITVTIFFICGFLLKYESGSNIIVSTYI
jgi:hypothetical protein